METRKLWFITRPERDPKFHVDALRALQKATDDFTIKWARNRLAHKRYEQVLAEENIKRPNISNDGSGGRTWAAMLKTFSYVYIDDEGFLRLTKVGEQLLNGNSVRENVKKQILTLQIPNAYYLESGFRPKFEDDFQIRPARFLIRLVNQSSLSYFLTKEEIVFFALRAKRDSEVTQVTQEIINYRNASAAEKERIKEEIAATFEHRSRSDSLARTFVESHGDVAHTFMLLCDYTGLVDYIRGDALRVPENKQKETSVTLQDIDTRYPFNKRYLISLERFYEHAGLDVDSYKASPYHNIPPATNAAKSIQKVQQILADYPMIQSKTQEEVSSILQSEFSEKEASKYASLLTQDAFASLNEDFVEFYLNETNPLLFEDKSAEVLRAIGFEVDLRPSSGTSTQIELIVHLNEEEIVLLDTKMYRPKFPLSANLASHMASEYIPNYQGFKNKNVIAFGYIVAEDWSGEKNLQRVTEKANQLLPGANIQGAIFSAQSLLGFLDYCIDHHVPVAERMRMFSSLFINKGYRTASDMINNALK